MAYQGRTWLALAAAAHLPGILHGQHQCRTCMDQELLSGQSFCAWGWVTMTPIHIMPAGPRSLHEYHPVPLQK
ncbi:hypothetical protein V8E55_008626 [Tylopilus felleus]